MIKTIKEIIENRYVIPLYQRNFAWGDQEIRQLILDLYQSMVMNQPAYFIGSLVVMRREIKDSILMEVIDGQQRLTVLSLILKYLDPDNPILQQPFLSYDSRTEVNDFLNQYHKQKGPIDPDAKWIQDIIKKYPDISVRDYCNAIDYINSAPIDSLGKNILCSVLDAKDKQKFSDYILSHVMMVLVDMPVNTDVANYFEIMNNRGAQLQKHEVLKSLMMGKIERTTDNKQESVKLRAIFSKIWDACSDMDHMVQRNFKPHEVQQIIFGPNYDNLIIDNVKSLGENASDTRSGIGISTILDSNTIIAENSEIDEDDAKQDLGGQKAIIDFPNFLLHVFRVLYNGEYINRRLEDVKITCSDDNERNEYSVPLHEKELLNVYRRIEDIVNPVEFIKKLLYYRVIFDRYIVKTVDIASNDFSSDEEASDDDVKWTLHRPGKRTSGRYGYEYVGFQDTFTGVIQGQIIKALSMLQVTHRARRYKNYLTEILSWFSDGKVEKEGTWYIDKLNRLILSEFESDEQYESLRLGKAFENEDALACGTGTHHFLFNFIDYLYWAGWIKGKQEFPELKFLKKDFTYRYFNSVEHHLPQSLAKEGDLVDSLGNLCLISKSMNSRLGAESPTGKAAPPEKHGKYYKDDLPPTRKIIYDLTNKEGNWSNKQIGEHYNNLVALLKARTSILGTDTVNPEDVDVIRALLCKFDLCQDCAWSKEGNRYTIGIDKENAEQNEALSELKDWIQSNPMADIEEFITIQLKKNSKLKNEPWRYLLVKYPGALRYCEARRVAFRDNDYWVTLIQRQKIYYQYKELMTYAVTQELIAKGIESTDYIQTIHGKLRDRGEIRPSGIPLYFYHRYEDRSWKYFIRSDYDFKNGELECLKQDGWIGIPSIGYVYQNNQYLLETKDENPIEEIKLVTEKLVELYLQIKKAVGE